MRENKYRGGCVHENWWAGGDLIHRGEKVFIYNDYNEYEVEVDEETIGQYTGVFDKNTKDIYEGDIIRYRTYGAPVSTLYTDEYLFVVVFNEKCCKFELVNVRDSDLRYELHMNCSDNYMIEGNIYDNPELLKGE